MECFISNQTMMMEEKTGKKKRQVVDDLYRLGGNSITEPDKVNWL